MKQVVETLYGPVEKKMIEIAKKIELLICDVDGVFSDGLIYIGNNGEELKTFHTRDGYGIRLLINAGIKIAVITARQSQIVENRMKTLGITLVYQGQNNKIKAYQKICKKLNVSPENVGYIGDDLTDFPVMEQVALRVCVADGHPLLAKHANYVTKIKGGHGAIREVCDLILHARNFVYKDLSI
ncbi:3-deoxy-D-manno-octulosonate 8-phosphate phosphatase [Candidatus Photodesmus blepharus]|uniref:3-deoxy-D-manno-octulosonate 8-phosphate phosphatase KdsC n=1 Tax=Candidatus Photodesmus blepharonis TaxID=1179155 RepID=A0A084CM44_9GAMM|nr:3-deoxy-manno-octulosonate-8-phosphatase KdsC [Candidatus Photodesmus blepharus]KEY90873.1 3-deoxy-D-manno-octulosonate 8-phosphate phosphatase [Candidatus Photodesmus blepharus]